MPAESSHIAQAEKNESFYRALLSNPDSLERYADWQVVVLFYAALHYADAFFARAGLHPSNHRERDRLVAQTPELSRIYPEYRTLYDSSLDARYNLVIFPRQLVEVLYAGPFTSVRNHIRSSLGMS